MNKKFWITFLKYLTFEKMFVPSFNFLSNAIILKSRIILFHSIKTFHILFFKELVFSNFLNVSFSIKEKSEREIDLFYYYYDFFWIVSNRSNS